MQEVSMKRGDQVETLDGKRSGTVVATFTDWNGERRIVVNVGGDMRIYPPDDLHVTCSAKT
jgi:hypothetical protein